MMTLRSTETHNFTMKNLTLSRPKLRNSQSTNQIVRFLNYGVNVIEFSIRLKNWPAGFGIRSRDSIIIPLMIPENRVSFSLLHYESLLNKVYRRDTRDLSS